MPLTAAKIKHIQAVLRRAMSGRQQTMNLTIKLANGSTSVLQVQGVFRPMADWDPTVDLAPHDNEIREADALLQINTQDITLAQLRACIYVEPAVSSGADAFASRYLISSIESKGMVPGGDRYIVTLDRLRV